MGNKGVLFVFSGPSGVGKGTLKAHLVEEFGDVIAFSVSATTRSPRPGETDGVDYFFITREEFDARVAKDDFLEYATFAGSSYGTPRAEVQRQLELGKNVLLEIDVQGADQVRSRMPECVSVFILPPSMEELERRLRGRGTETEERVAKRLAAAAGEIACADRYDYRIVNDDEAAAYAQLRSVFMKCAGLKA